MVPPGRVLFDHTAPAPTQTVLAEAPEETALTPAHAARWASTEPLREADAQEPAVS